MGTCARAQGVREITSIFSCWERGGGEGRQAPAGGAGLACVGTGRWVCELPKGLHLGETAARSAAPSQPINCERVVSDQERVGWVLLKAGPEPARAERCELWPREELLVPFGCNCRSPHVAAPAEKPAGRGGLGCRGPETWATLKRRCVPSPGTRFPLAVSEVPLAQETLD